MCFGYISAFYLPFSHDVQTRCHEFNVIDPFRNCYENWKEVLYPVKFMNASTISTPSLKSFSLSRSCYSIFCHNPLSKELVFLFRGHSAYNNPAMNYHYGGMSSLFVPTKETYPPYPIQGFVMYSPVDQS